MGRKGGSREATQETLTVISVRDDLDRMAVVGVRTSDEIPLCNLKAEPRGFLKDWKGGCESRDKSEDYSLSNSKGKTAAEIRFGWRESRNVEWWV